jgi:hypothetical protein
MRSPCPAAARTILELIEARQALFSWLNPGKLYASLAQDTNQDNTC